MKQKLGNRRVTGTEQFYTPSDVARNLTQFALEHIPNWQNKAFLEPAAGTGSFLKALQENGVEKLTAIDLHPKHNLVTQADFLEFTTTERGIVTISNPPFGRNNALSIPFFNRAATFSDHIAFLVPRSWRKWSVQNRLDPHFQLVADIDVAVGYEDEFGEAVSESNELRTCFQVWSRTETARQPIKIPDNKLVAKASPRDADVALRVFGFGCGTVIWDFERQPNTTLMFLKIHDPRAGELLAELDYQRFTKNTAYTEALAFTELNYLLNEQVFGDPMAQRIDT